MKKIDAQYIKGYMDDALSAATYASETLTGRDTHPLIDEKIHDPFAYFVALRIEEIETLTRSLRDHLHNYLAHMD